MTTKFIEATEPTHFNHGKFMVARFTAEEWAQQSVLDSEFAVDIGLLKRCGWTNRHITVLDLQTGEGVIVRPGGCAPADLNKHKVWVCPMFEPFLTWLYQQDLSDLDKLPALVTLPAGTETAMAGYRREGK